ncbi:MAG: COQ9 family protein, partial [Rickettsiales bacterium]|nr:COQ9 family protein [Rickettsiales bacterium]
AKRKTLAVDTISYLLMPHHMVIANKLLFRTSGMIWRAIGDTSTDYNYYSKRLLLSGVYSSSLLYWINDDSDEHEDTYAFIDRRIADVMTLGKCRAKYMSVDAAKNIPFIRLFSDKFSSSV